ncbi:MAG: cupin domain-containing protein [Aquificota bacterium]|nr:cupin domain-containing protein [Aquificota bacterium]MDQ7082080.1 cupin domain-containing protein [Aquificota bacterium]
MKVVSPEGVKDLSGLIEEKAEKVKEIEAVKINETEEMTQLLVFIRTAEVPHYHRDHDLTFLVVRGHGELYLDGKREKLKEGDVAFIPRGKVHFYTNTSVVSVLLATFSPSYDGKDSVKVEL